MAALTVFTTFQRVFHVRQQLAGRRCNRRAPPGSVSQAGLLRQEVVFMKLEGFL